MTNNLGLFDDGNAPTVFTDASRLPDFIAAMTGLVVNTITALPETARLPFTHEALQLELDNLATSSNSSSAANAAAVAGTATILSASFVLDQRDRFRRGVCELVRAVCLDSLDTSHPVDSATTTTSALHIPPPSLLALASIDAFVTLNQQIQALRRTHPCHEHATRHSALVSLNSVSAYPGPITLLDPLALASFIIDALWLMDIETEGGNPALIDCDAVRGRLFSFAGALVKKRDIIPQKLLLERMEPEFLEQISLVTSVKQVNTRTNRINTAQLYKQQKFNLLREESEGYSKLIVELYSNLPEYTDKMWTMGMDRQSLLEKRRRVVDARVEIVLDNVKSLIGYFDLDPNRVLDLIFDVFAANCVEHWDFYLALLEKSTWRPTRKMVKKKKSTSDGSDGAAAYQTTKTTTTTSTPVFEEEPKSVCAQILGFKFSYYNRKREMADAHNSDTATSSSSSYPTTPSQLFWMTAILMKHDFIRLDDLYPHLGPNDEHLDVEYEEFLRDIEEQCKSAGKFTGVAGLTGSLDDGTAQSTNTAAANEANPASSKSSFRSSQFKNQKAGLVNSLVAIGALKQARVLLLRLPRLPEIYPEIAEHMCKLLHVIIEPVYMPLRPTNNFPSATKPLEDEADLYPSMPLFKHGKVEGVLRGRKSAHPKYAFFYHLWREKGLPSCTDLNQALDLLRKLLIFVGPNLHRDVKLMWKIIRIGVSHLAQNNDEITRNSWLNMIAHYLFPALSLTRENSGLAQELFKLIKLYPYETRFALYGEWKNSSYDSNPILKLAKTGCSRDTRYLLKRLSKDTMKEYGRHIGKLVHSNPVVAFSIIIEQLESYNNQIPCFVDATRYLTELEFDILSFCILEALASEKSRIQPNGTTIEKWLVSLSTLCGSIWKKPQIDLLGLLSYLSKQLTLNNIYDMAILQELLGQMTGIVAVEEPTESQLLAYGGGYKLKREVLAFESVRSTKKPTARLTAALGDSGLMGPMGILMAQQKREIVFNTESRELKILGWNYDLCHKTMLQYYEYLFQSLSEEEYVASVTDIEDLCINMALDSPTAFHILRRKLNWLIKTSPTNVRVATPSSAYVVAMDIDNKTETLANAATTNTIANADTGSKMEIDLPSTEKSESTLTLPITSVDDPEVGLVWQRGLHSTINSVIPILPAKVWTCISPQFYVTFWQLSLNDIFAPKNLYLSEITKLKTAVDVLERELRMDQRNPDNSKKRKEKDRAQNLIVPLEIEMKEQELHVKIVTERLDREKNAWFSRSLSRNELVIHILQYCIFPRCLFSSWDAVFCARFINMMHKSGTAKFGTLFYYDKLFDVSNLRATIFSCTEIEAKNFGHFLSETLAILFEIRSNEEKFKAECLSVPGFQKKWPTTEETAGEYLTYREFQQVLYKWHNKLFKCMLACLGSTEYMQIRNSIFVLDKLNPHFPKVDDHGSPIEDAVKIIEEQETERADLKQLARSYKSKLNNLKSKWITRSEMCPTLKPRPKPKPVVSLSAKDPAPTSATPTSLNESPVMAVKESNKMEVVQTSLKSTGNAAIVVVAGAQEEVQDSSMAALPSTNTTTTSTTTPTTTTTTTLASKNNPSEKPLSSNESASLVPSGSVATSSSSTSEKERPDQLKGDESRQLAMDSSPRVSSRRPGSPSNHHDSPSRSSGGRSRREDTSTNSHNTRGAGDHELLYSGRDRDGRRNRAGGGTESSESKDRKDDRKDGSDRGEEQLRKDQQQQQSLSSTTLRDDRLSSRRDEDRSGGRSAAGTGRADSSRREEDRSKDQLIVKDDRNVRSGGGVPSSESSRRDYNSDRSGRGGDQDYQGRERHRDDGDNSRRGDQKQPSLLSSSSSDSPSKVLGDRSSKSGSGSKPSGLKPLESSSSSSGKKDSRIKSALEPGEVTPSIIELRKSSISSSVGSGGSGGAEKGVVEGDESGGKLLQIVGKHTDDGSSGNSSSNKDKSATSRSSILHRVGGHQNDDGKQRNSSDRKGGNNESSRDSDRGGSGSNRHSDRSDSRKETRGGDYGQRDSSNNHNSDPKRIVRESRGRADSFDQGRRSGGGDGYGGGGDDDRRRKRDVQTSLHHYQNNSSSNNHMNNNNDGGGGRGGHGGGDAKRKRVDEEDRFPGGQRVSADGGGGAGLSGDVTKRFVSIDSYRPSEGSSNEQDVSRGKRGRR